MRAREGEAWAGGCRTEERRSCVVVVEEMEMMSPRMIHLGNGFGIRPPRLRPRR